MSALWARNKPRAFWARLACERGTGKNTAAVQPRLAQPARVSLGAKVQIVAPGAWARSVTLMTDRFGGL